MTGRFNNVKQQIIDTHDIHHVAQQLGMKPGKGQTGADVVYHSPHHTDKTPSLSVFTSNNRSGWKDHSNPEYKGDVFSLVQYVHGSNFMDALKWLANMYRIEIPPKEAPANQQKVDKPWHVTVAERTLKTDRKPASDYLQSRGISAAVIEAAINNKTLGFNNYFSQSKPAGTVGHAGHGVSFVVRGIHDNQIEAIDTRYFEPELNGGVKTNSLGKKMVEPWCSDWRKFKRAKKVFITEAAINALSIETAFSGIPFHAAIALRGLAISENIGTDHFKNKFCVLVPDYDKPFDKDDKGNKHQLFGHRPGVEMMWKLYDRLTEAGVACIIIDQEKWTEGWDINDYLQSHTVQETKTALGKYEKGLIAGYPVAKEFTPAGFKRIYLPAYDFSQYWRFQVEPDFTRYIEKYKEATKDDDGNTKESANIEMKDLCGFRVAGIQKLSIQDWKTSCYNTRPQNTEVVFAASCQSPHNNNELVTETMTSPQFGSINSWAKFGAIFAPTQFMRMITILSRTIAEKEKNAVNFVGLVYKQGKVVINEGPDCFFQFPEEQCPYHALTFKSGPLSEAQQVIHAFQQTFSNGGGLMPLVWALGAHLKIFLGFYPHIGMEAEKGAGKSSYMDKLAVALSMQVFSSETLTTAYRIICATSYSSMPVMWEELSSNAKSVIDAATGNLQQAYNYRYSKRGNQGKSFLTSTPVFLGGEEVDMNSIDGKRVRVSITENDQGPEISPDLPEFPLRNWLEFLSELNQKDVLAALDVHRDQMWQESRSSKNDGNAKRMVKNWAVLKLAWRYLCEFAQIDHSLGNFESQIITEMNSYLADTVSTREPWIWIVEIILSEIDADRFQYPYKIQKDYALDTEVFGQCDALIIRHTHIMSHLQHSNHLRDSFNSMPIKTARSLRKQMQSAGVIAAEGVERTINGRRTSGMMAINLQKLNDYGLFVSTPDRRSDSFGKTDKAA